MLCAATRRHSTELSHFISVLLFFIALLYYNPYIWVHMTCLSLLVFSLLLTETMGFTTALEFDAVASLSKRMSKDRVPSTVHDSAGDR